MILPTIQPLPPCCSSSPPKAIKPCQQSLQRWAMPDVVTWASVALVLLVVLGTSYVVLRAVRAHGTEHARCRERGDEAALGRAPLEQG